MSLGQIVFDESWPVPIASVAFEAGAMMLVSEPMPGPLDRPAIPDCQYAIYGTDGQLVMRGRVNVAGFHIEPDERVTYLQPIGFASGRPSGEKW